MDIFLQQLINSLSVASVTILIGMGITLIFGLAGIVNFAQGEFLMVGGMVTWALVSAGVNFFLAMIAAMAVVGLLGYVAERTLFRFTLSRPMNGFIMSIGLSVILQNVVIKLVNEVQKSIPDPISTVWVVGGVYIIAMARRRRCVDGGRRRRHLFRHHPQPLRRGAPRERRRSGYGSADGHSRAPLRDRRVHLRKRPRRTRRRADDRAFPHHAFHREPHHHPRLRGLADRWIGQRRRRRRRWPHSRARRCARGPVRVSAMDGRLCPGGHDRHPHSPAAGPARRQHWGRRPRER